MWQALLVVAEDLNQFDDDDDDDSKMSLLQKTCLQFCLTLLDHQLTQHKRDSALVCALAVLGVREKE